jgi:hypothetical protein
MPRVIDYSPVDAVGLLSQQVANERARQQEEALNARRIQQPQATMQPVQQDAGGMTAADQIAQNKFYQAHTGKVYDNKTGTAWDPFNGYQSMTPGQPARERFEDSSGNTLAVTPGQKAQLENINERLTGDDRTSAENVALGIKDQDITEYTDLTGKTFKLPAKEAAARGQRDYAIKQQASQFGQRLQLQQQQAQQKEQALSQKMDLATDRYFDKQERDKLGAKIGAAKSRLNTAQDKYKANPYDDATAKELEAATRGVDDAFQALDAELSQRLEKRSEVARKIQGKSLDQIRKMGGDQEALLEEYFRQLTAKNQAAASQPAATQQAAPAYKAGTIANGPNGPMRFNGQTWEPYIK